MGGARLLDQFCILIYCSGDYT